MQPRGLRENLSQNFPLSQFSLTFPASIFLFSRHRDSETSTLPFDNPQTIKLRFIILTP